jgi:hypothetical protein
VLEHSYLILEPCQPGLNRTCTFRFQEIRLDIWSTGMILLRKRTIIEALDNLEATYPFI